MKKATLLNMSNAHKRIADLERALKCVGDVSEQLYDEGDPLIDHGVIKVLREDCGWTSSSNVDDAIQWDYIDYEYTGKDTSLYNFPQPDYLMDGLSEYIVIDQNGGYSSLATSFATDYGVSPYIDFNKTVTKIDYSHTGDANYKVKVDVRATSCTHYLAKYVILTVPVGVVANNLIEFHPPLFTTDNPLKMGLYIKIFYKFNFQVGPRYNHEFLWSVLQGSTSGDNDEHCMNWQNMDAKRHSKRRGTDTTYYPGAHVWVCTLTTVAFHKILAAGDGKRLRGMSQVGAIRNRTNGTGYEFYFTNKWDSFSVNIRVFIDSFQGLQKSRSENKLSVKH
jgi:Flavin containing amine oxidoreductase